MNTAMIVIIFIVAMLVAVGFLVLVFTLVPAISQFKFLLRDLELTSGEVRELAKELKRLSALTEDRLEKVGGVLSSSRRTVDNVGDTLQLLNQNVLKRSAGLLAFIPALRFGWKMVKKIKGGK